VNNAVDNAGLAAQQLAICELLAADHADQLATGQLPIENKGGLEGQALASYASNFFRAISSRNSFGQYSCQYQTAKSWREGQAAGITAG
jgi:hypothetical protein